MRTCPIVIGHRGNSGVAPANTLVSFEQAIAFGVDMIEVDVQCTRDGHIVLIHDDTVDGTTNGTGIVSEMTFDEIRRLDAGSWKDTKYSGEKVPRFEEMLELARGRVMVNLDIKNPRAIPQMVSLLRRERMLYDVVVSGSTERNATLVRAEESALPVLMDFDKAQQKLSESLPPYEFARACVERALRGGFVGLNPGHRFVTPEFVREARRHGLGVWTWTVDDSARMAELAAWNVDAITSNYPERLIQTLR